MTTSGTKTRALCVATRCTSIDQFVATFHRFCGDDQTFFVATMTSRPIGLETAFSIQLADKQPVLRGLCIVLDAWATPENRYRRPGIRLGIKRLTAESQLVFDRLRAASRSPALLESALVIAEATPPHGTALPPAPTGTTRPPPLPVLAGVTRPPQSALRSASTPPPLPSLVAPRTGLPSVRGLPPPVPLAPISVDPKPPVVVEAKPPAVVEVKPPAVVEAKPLPPAVEAKPPAVVEAKPLPPAPKPPAFVTPKPLAPLPASAFVARPEPVVAKPEPVVARPEPVVAPPVIAPPVVARPIVARPTPPPIAVTRFQVALRVDTAPPSVEDVEFKPTHLIARARAEPRIISEPPPDESLIDPGTPAIIIDRPSGPQPRDTLPGFAPIPAALRAIEPLPAIAPLRAAVEPHAPEAGADQRTPGSALILPANPLQNLSDESLEGFVDCTIYEETGNFFHPGIDAPDWSDELADPPASPLTTRASTVPAMPFDAAPNLTVRTFGDTESLRVAPDEPGPGPVTPVGPIDRPTEPLIPRIAYAAHLASPAAAQPPGAQVFPPAPMFALDELPPPMSTGAHHAPLLDEHAGSPVAWFDGVSAQVDHAASPPRAAEHPYSPDHPYGIQGYDPNLVPIHANGYPTIDPALYVRPEALPAAPPPERRARPRAGVPRWVVIAGTAAAAIVVAIVIARMVRGASTEAAPSALASHATPTSATTRSPSPVHVAPREAPAPPSRDPKPLPPVPASDSMSPEEDGDAVAGGTPVVGSGPCKLTVSTTPAGSLVRFDDQPMGPSPITIEGTCDKHKIDVAHARYQGAMRWVTLAADKPQDVDISLPRPVHAVTVTSFPPGAELSIDGHRAGTTPTIVQMMGFASVNLTFTKAGFQSVTKKVYSKLPQDHVFVKLSK